jgi:hypothetical protein
MAKQVNLNLTSPLEMVFRKTVPIAASQTIYNGQWFELDVNGAAVIADADTTKAVRFLAFNDSISPDVQATLPDGTTVSTGGMAGIIGTVEGNVNTNGYTTGETYTAGAPLTVKSGKLFPAASGDAIFAYVKTAIGADGLLWFVGVSGYALSFMA